MDEPNVVKTTIVDKKVQVKESPNAPTAANGSTWYQRPGSSLNAYVCGIVKDTNIESSNKSLSHACDVQIPAKLAKFLAGFNLHSLIEGARTSEVGVWLAGAQAPILEAVKHVVDAVNFVVTQINKVQKFISDVMTEIGELISAIQAVIDFISSLPDKFLAFVQGCLEGAQKSLTDSIGLAAMG